MNQPLRTFLLIALVVAIMLGLHWLPTLTVGDLELRKVNMLSDILPTEQTAEEPDLEFLVADTTATTAAVMPMATDTTELDTVDSVLLSDSDSVASIRPDVNIDSLMVSGGFVLDFSGGAPGGLAHLRTQLQRVGELGRPVRIAYYGDSFIEGDILSCDLRELFQNDYGGEGVGWVDCGSRISGFRQTVKHQFSRLKEYEVVQRPFRHANEGIAERYFTAENGARITMKGSKFRQHLSAWQQATFYLRTDSGVRVTTYVAGDTLIDRVRGGGTLQALNVKRGSMSSVSYRLDSIGDGTLLYGVALESQHGVIVDNFSMRGSSGTPLAQIPMSTLREFARVRPYDMIVLHYGLNVASAKSHPSVYKAYAKNMGTAIAHLKAAYPEATILVVSMPDRDQRTDAGLHTMRGVEALVACQQLMAQEHGVVFFNLFQAMGGRESMKSLVDRGMANKDYTHLNFGGGRHLARLFYNSLRDALQGKSATVTNQTVTTP